MYAFPQCQLYYITVNLQAKLLLLLVIHHLLISLDNMAIGNHGFFIPNLASNINTS